MGAVKLHVAGVDDAPASQDLIQRREREAIEARLWIHIQQHDALAKDIAVLKALIAEESRRYATICGVTFRPDIDRLRYQLCPGAGR